VTKELNVDAKEDNIKNRRQTIWAPYKTDAKGSKFSIARYWTFVKIAIYSIAISLFYSQIDAPLSSYRLSCCRPICLRVGVSTTLHSDMNVTGFNLLNLLRNNYFSFGAMMHAFADMWTWQTDGQTENDFITCPHALYWAVRQKLTYLLTYFHYWLPYLWW